MSIVLTQILSGLVLAGKKIVVALLVWLIGKVIIKKIEKLFRAGKLTAKMEETVRAFAASVVKGVLYVVLVVSVIGILGVPMASIITVLASAGMAVGLALQGALSNLAGGVMLMIFHPFKVGDYVEAGGAEGTVKEINLFYTVFITVDNKRVTVPNGTLMNANVVDYSSEDTRRVDLTFSCAKNETPAKVRDILEGVVSGHSKVLRNPEPFARLSGGTNEAMEFTVRAWVKSADYWDVYFDLQQQIVEAFAVNGIQAPAARVLNEIQK